MARLFLALWPPAAARAALADLARSVAARHGGRPVPEPNLHLTLVFLGEVEASRRRALEDAAGGAGGRAFTLEFDRVGGFRRAGVAWAGCDRVPPALLALQAQLERRIREAGFAPDPRPYAPHLTLARRLRGPVEAGGVEPVSWRARSYALVESARDRGGYRTLAEWSLEDGEP